MTVRARRHGLLARRQAKSAVSLLTSLVFGAIGLVLTPPEPVEATSTWPCTMQTDDGAYVGGVAYVTRMQDNNIELYRIRRTTDSYGSWTAGGLSGPVASYPISSSHTANALMMDASGQLFIHVGALFGGEFLVEVRA